MPSLSTILWLTTWWLWLAYGVALCFGAWVRHGRGEWN
jgi:hypothetical protein